MGLLNVGASPWAATVKTNRGWQEELVQTNVATASSVHAVMKRETIHWINDSSWMLDGEGGRVFGAALMDDFGCGGHRGQFSIIQHCIYAD